MNELRHLPAVGSTDAQPVHSDASSWFGYDDAHYSRKTIEITGDLANAYDSDDPVFVVEVLYGTNRGGQINVWVNEESSLEHIWKPATIDGESYRKADEVNFMSWEPARREYAELDDASDVNDLMVRNA